MKPICGTIIHFDQSWNCLKTAFIFKTSSYLYNTLTDINILFIIFNYIKYNLILYNILHNLFIIYIEIYYKYISTT